MTSEKWEKYCRRYRNVFVVVVVAFVVAFVVVVVVLAVVVEECCLFMFELAPQTPALEL